MPPIMVTARPLPAEPAPSPSEDAKLKLNASLATHFPVAPSARSARRRTSTLPMIPELPHDNHMQHVRPHLEELDTYSFSSLTSQLMVLCEALQDAPPPVRGGPPPASSALSTSGRQSDRPTGAAWDQNEDSRSARRDNMMVSSELSSPL
uniref:Uncharacterized protein n=1 Tax=Haptolina brevifila TaxID=156173 RepID=A0A7S2DDQ1_9EUKA|mmetsp:Transcript_36147/g.71856  ORF Transcript_36147/g.71856 Transcript_36147/m.71856 type:complete len:150 (+) Transcript_36147:128-577(+)